MYRTHYRVCTAPMAMKQITQPRTASLITTEAIYRCGASPCVRSSIASPQSLKIQAALAVKKAAAGKNMRLNLPADVQSLLQQASILLSTPPSPPPLSSLRLLLLTRRASFFRV